jgi:hypothetical protein
VLELSLLIIIVLLKGSVQDAPRKTIVELRIFGGPMRFEYYLTRHSGQTFNEATNRTKVTAKQQLFFRKFSAAKCMAATKEFIRA